MSAFLNALGAGVSAKKILEYLMRKSPNMSEKISKALASGLSAEKIIEFFSKDKNFSKLRNEMEKSYPMQFNENPLVQAQNVRNQNLGSDLASSLQRNIGPALGTAAAVGTSYALSRAIPKILQPSQNAPNLPELQAGSQLETPLVQQTQQPPVSPVAPSVAKPAQPVQAQGIVNPKEYLEKHGILDRVKSLLKAGNTPEGVAAALGMKRSGETKLDPELIANVEAYSKLPPEEIHDSGKIADLVPKEHHISKGTSVATPQGIGDVLEVRNGKALVEVDGKKHQVEEKKLLKPPKEAAIEALELIKSFTPEQQRSTHHMLNSYDEEEKKGFFVFHNGSAYVVDDISPEEYKELSEEIEEAKTTGETVIGKWAAGEGSRGAGYNKIVKGVRDRKVVPELKKKYRKLKVGYNLLAEWQRLLNEKD